MDRQPGNNSAIVADPMFWQEQNGNPEDPFNLSLDALLPLSDLNFTFDHLAFSEQYPLDPMEPNRLDPHTLIPSRVENPPANHHSPIYTNAIANPHVGAPSILPCGMPNNINPNRKGQAGTNDGRSDQRKVVKPDVKKAVLRCFWKDCDYKGTFGRKAELMRHVDTRHINPRSYQCSSCGKIFNRKDNLGEHVQRIHA